MENKSLWLASNFPSGRDNEFITIKEAVKEMKLRSFPHWAGYRLLNEESNVIVEISYIRLNPIIHKKAVEEGIARFKVEDNKYVYPRGWVKSVLYHYFKTLIVKKYSEHMKSIGECYD